MVNGDNSDEVVVTSAPKKPWIPVYLTSREVKGLQLVVLRMKDWPKTNVPDDIENPDQLLDRLQVIALDVMRRENEMQKSSTYGRGRIYPSPRVSAMIDGHSSLAEGFTSPDTQIMTRLK